MKKTLDTLTMRWNGEALFLIDQRKLPFEVEYVECRTFRDVGAAIRDMVVRGAPAIGAAAAFGYVLGAMKSKSYGTREIDASMKLVKEVLSQSRPTAVNLFWALKRMHSCYQQLGSCPTWVDELEVEALRIAQEDIQTNKRIGQLGEPLLSDGSSVITHCNAGALATVDYGTALGVIRTAKEKGKSIHVFVDETRPYLQGARLTAWELMSYGIECTLICDSMAAWVMKTREVNAVIVGADRIAANGDSANKIGSYSLAVIAAFHRIPFYVVAPSSTIDLEVDSGEEIPIEQRSSVEVTHLSGMKVAPDGVVTFNPSFDVIPSELITAIITENAVHYSPYSFRPVDDT